MSNLFGWNDDGARADKDRPEREIFSGLHRGHRNRPSALVDAAGAASSAVPSAAPGAALGADRAAETRGRPTLARSLRAQTGLEPPVRV